MNNVFGPALSPDQRVDRVVRFNSEELNRVLFEAALEKSGVPLASWVGHVQYETSIDPPGVAATVYVWEVSDEDALASTTKAK